MASTSRCGWVWWSHREIPVIQLLFIPIFKHLNPLGKNMIGLGKLSNFSLKLLNFSMSSNKLFFLTLEFKPCLINCRNIF